MRTAERVLVLVDEFEATTFEDLYQNVKKIPWADLIYEDTNFIVNGRSKNSKLFSISDSQRITERAIIDKLMETYDSTWFKKSLGRMDIEVNLNRDIAQITIDTTGPGLHKRGYRQRNYKAPISETIAAAMVILSYWNPERVLCDPFCGSGTILIEAAMIGKNIAPGIMREFAAKDYKFIGEEPFKEVKKEAYSKILYDKKLSLYGSDIEKGAVEVAKENAEILGLEEDITFFQRDIRDFDIHEDYGILITNPPYGVRLEEKKEVKALEIELGNLYRDLKNWSFYVITASEDFPKNFKKKEDRNRKLYNGKIKTYYYQYYGPKPK